jgi:hypothetical protein
MYIVTTAALCVCVCVCVCVCMGGGGFECQQLITTPHCDTTHLFNVCSE